MKSLLRVIFILLITIQALAQAPLAKMWDKRFGGNAREYLNSFQQTTDSGYILGGFSNSGISGNKTQPSWGSWDYWVVKVDSIGNMQWDKRFGGTGGDELYSLQQTTDGGYILGGISHNSSISGDKTQPDWGSSDYWVVKIDSLGNKQWDKLFGGTRDDVLKSLQQTTDGGYILGGYSWSDSTGNKTQANWGSGSGDYWIVKIDSLGNKQWDKRFGGTDLDVLLSLQQTTEGGYILGGYSDSGISGDKTQPSRGSSDYWVVKIDSLGNKQWDKRFGGTGFDWLYSLQQTIDGGYILAGYSVSGISGDKTQPSWGGWDYWIVKIDSLGNKEWDKDFGGIDHDGTDEPLHISQTIHREYLIAGTSYSPMSGDKTENNLGLEQTWVIKTDSFGNKIWDKTIFTTGHDEQGIVIQTKDRCYTVANYTAAGVGGYKTQPNWDTTNVHYDYWIVKFCDSIQPCPALSLTYTVAVAKPELRNGAMRVLVSGGDPPYQYSLDSISFQSSNTFISLALGTYQVYVTDNKGCTGQGTFTINETNCNCTNH